MLTYSILIAVLLLIKSNAQIPCTRTGRTANTITVGPLVINALTCLDDNMMYIDIQYSNYFNNWFGIVFSYDMAGYSLIYTSGQSWENYRQAGLYTYTLTVSGRSATYYSNDNWEKVSETQFNGIRVIYKKSISSLPSVLNQAYVPVSYAIAYNTLTLGDHDQENKDPSMYGLLFSGEGGGGGGGFTTTRSSSNQFCTSNSMEGYANIANKLQVRGIICSNEDMIYIDITYSSYKFNWFGVVFNSDNMYGNALIYTTGKWDETTRPQAMYAYNNEEVGSNPRSNGVIYSPYNDWTEVSTDYVNNGIQVVYKKSLSQFQQNNGWNMATKSLKIGYALGDSLDLTYHNYLRNDEGSAYTLTFTGESTGGNGGRGCNKQDLRETTGTLDEFEVTVFVNCDFNTVDVTISTSEYKYNWFGIVFSNSMTGDALIYTTGKSTDNLNGYTALYPYTINGYNENEVVYDGYQNNWRQISERNENGKFIIRYQQDLDKTSTFSRETETVYFKWAKGDNSLQLNQHSSNSYGRAEQSGKLDLLTGASSNVRDDLSMEIAHGVLMWLAWAVFASIAIMASAFRYLCGTGSLWFKIHKYVQALVVILTIIAFIIAIVFTEERNRLHFNNAHMILGIIVIIFCILQALNAVCRPHPIRGTSTKKGGKPTKRIIWEWTHKVMGYITWILACITIMLGMQLIDEQVLSYVHMFLWCGFLLMIYIVLFIIKIFQDKREGEVESVNTKDEDSDESNKESSASIPPGVSRERTENTKMLEIEDKD